MEDRLHSFISPLSIVNLAISWKKKAVTRSSHDFLFTKFAKFLYSRKIAKSICCCTFHHLSEKTCQSLQSYSNQVYDHLVSESENKKGFAA